MMTSERANWLVRSTLRLEEAAGLDGVVHAVEPSVRFVFGSGVRKKALCGDWLGHAVHPLLTDVVIGSWTSATVLDLVGGREARAAAQTLVGVGLLAAPPTAWTGWAEWVAADARDKRVGLVHANTNAVAIAAYTASWMLRRRGRDRAGVGWGLVGLGVSGVGAYLGGHLVAARNVGSRHPAYADSP